jgi:putative endonuclease
MFYAYVLRSLSAAYYYKGHCKDLQDRLKQHNSGMTRSIRKYIPFEIIYFEEFESLEDAVKREKYSKTASFDARPCRTTT